MAGSETHVEAAGQRVRVGPFPDDNQMARDRYGRPGDVHAVIDDETPGDLSLVLARVRADEEQGLGDGPGRCSVAIP